MYKLGILLFEIGLTILFWLILPFMFIERIYHKKFYGWKEKFGNIEPKLNSEKIIMIHACSVGEVTAIENLAKRIKIEFPDYKLVITTATYTGQEIANKKLGEIADFITYLPFDVPFAVNKFLDKLKPQIVLNVETEIWPYFAFACNKKRIKLYTINGRISDSTYKTYKMATFFFKHIMKHFTEIFTQSEEDKNKFISIGMPEDRTKFMGNLKFDVQQKECNIDLGQSNYKLLIAGSTHHGENEIVINTFKELKKDIKNLKLLIAPRHLERVPEVQKLLKEVDINYGLRSEDAKFNEHEVIILDTLGELGKIYALCDIAFIGGSFNKTGGHNPLEAAVYFKPTISGPSIHNFKDIYSILENSGAGKVVKTEKELQTTIKDLLTEQEIYEKAKKSCHNVFEQQKGAIDFVINKLKEVTTRS